MAKTNEASRSAAQQTKKRKSIDNDSRSVKRRRQYSYLKPHTRHISQELIRAEWKQLPKPAQQQVRDILLNAKRSTLNQIADGPRRKEADFVVNDVLRRLEKQLPRMPFPPNTKAAQLNYDQILEHSRTLEAEKGPLFDSVKLLEEEIQREDHRIELTQAELRKLKKDCKAAEKTRAARAAKSHSLLDDISTNELGFDDAESICLVPHMKSDSEAIIEDEPDEALDTVLSALRNHLDSISGNLEALPLIEREISTTSAMLCGAISKEKT